MFARIVSTICALVTALAAVLLMDCDWAFIAADTVGVCATADSLGLSQTAYLGVGLAVFAGMALIAIWVPGKSSDDAGVVSDREDSLIRNINRINGEQGALDRADDGELVMADPVTTSIDEPAVDKSRNAPVEPRARTAEGTLIARLEALEVALEAEAAEPTREETEQWMRLLREANDLHNRGELDSHEFRTINTRLLDLFIEPGALV